MPVYSSSSSMAAHVAVHTFCTTVTTVTDFSLSARSSLAPRPGEKSATMRLMVMPYAAIKPKESPGPTCHKNEAVIR
jgi:hypothetical protein